MPFTVQGDIVLNDWIANFATQGHLNVYVYYVELFGSEVFPPGAIASGQLGKGWIMAAGFPPLSYLLAGGYLWGLQAIRVFTFLGNWGYENLWIFPNQTRVVFFMKAMYVPFDFLFLWALLKTVGNRYRSTAYYAWAFNPFIIYVTYAWGQTDIIPASLTMIAIYFAKSSLSEDRLEKAILSCLALGLAASFKLFTLALLPVFAIIFARHLNRHILLFVLSGLSPFASALPFLSGPLLRSMFPFSDVVFQGGLQYSFQGELQYSLYIGFAAYLLILCNLYLAEGNYTFDRILAYGLAVFSIFFGFTAWAPNWFVWSLPFLLVAILRAPRLTSIYGFLALFYFLFVQLGKKVLWIGLFCPLTYTGYCLPDNVSTYRGTLGSFPSFGDLMGPQLGTLVGLAFTGIAALVFYLTYCIWVANQPADEEQRGMTTWLVILAIPIALAVLNLFLAGTYVAEHGLPIIQTILTKITADPTFFFFYSALVILSSLWPLLARTLKSK